jgi:t-SNARE complex subunit (syntaxin)
MKIKLTAEDFDRKVQRLLFVKQELETLTKEQDELINLLEGHYTKVASQEEIIQGVNFKMVKVPVNQGRNSYDADKLLPFIKAIRGAYNKVFKKNCYSENGYQC